MLSGQSRMPSCPPGLGRRWFLLGRWFLLPRLLRESVFAPFWRLRYVLAPWGIPSSSLHSQPLEVERRTRSGRSQPQLCCVLGEPRRTRLPLHVSLATSAPKHATQGNLAHLYAGLFTGVRGRKILRNSRQLLTAGNIYTSGKRPPARSTSGRKE